MTPAELEAIRTSDPERYEALTGPERDRQLAAAAARRGDPLYSSEHDPCRPTPYERQARAEYEAARAIGEPEPPVYGSSGG
ncbi:hypothetical protein [Micromonospora craniellae]|uniref:Uncharacterized protein n=1 Tax=Micromonospora craniellae TaxID=2294034 RepID=A0A372FRA3_9ACTN|nr:hypothetical protein [Micromonospora craniellae]QOC90689.1 hypothetical protein ID554_21430 [Micromonospora craniellae]RFS41028.1 hypothetical protein D0Q02_29665 [Micromonospora craniellae]